MCVVLNRKANAFAPACVVRVHPACAFSPFQNKGQFEEIYTQFQETAREVDAFLCACINALFVRRMKTQEALMLLSRWSFSPAKMWSSVSNVT